GHSMVNSAVALHRAMEIRVFYAGTAKNRANKGYISSVWRRVIFPLTERRIKKLHFKSKRIANLAFPLKNNSFEQ
ncbi:MAG TPA: hypothetical protein VKI61_18930, partial [Chitinophagaceae bacterium]|nr:hypothetical protein [Chitinophagaceae bacterium]